MESVTATARFALQHKALFARHEQAVYQIDSRAVVLCNRHSKLFSAVNAERFVLHLWSTWLVSNDRNCSNENTD